MDGRSAWLWVCFLRREGNKGGSADSQQGQEPGPGQGRPAYGRAAVGLRRQASAEARNALRAEVLAKAGGKP